MRRFRILSPFFLLLFSLASLKAADDDFLRLLRGEVDRQYALLQIKAKVYHLRFNVRDRHEVTTAPRSLLIRSVSLKPGLDSGVVSPQLF